MFLDNILHSKENNTKPIVICEYGAADGGISMVLMKELIGLNYSSILTPSLFS